MPCCVSFTGPVFPGSADVTLTLRTGKKFTLLAIIQPVRPGVFSNLLQVTVSDRAGCLKSNSNALSLNTMLCGKLLLLLLVLDRFFYVSLFLLHYILFFFKISRISVNRQHLRRRKWKLTPGFLPGESHGQRSLAGYSPWGRRELDVTEQLTHTYNICLFLPDLFYYAKYLPGSFILLQRADFILFSWLSNVVYLYATFSLCTWLWVEN